MPKTVIFTRHAESRANAGFATANVHSIPLSEKGLLQAEAVAASFPIVPELVVVSLFLRTQQTAAPLVAKLDGVKVEMWDMVHEFTYLDQEKHKNTTAQERQASVLEYWNRRDPFYRDGAAEESFFDLLRRAERLIKKLDEREEESIAIFSHGQFLTAVRIVQGLNRSVNSLSDLELIRFMEDFQARQTAFPILNATPMTWEELMTYRP